jgi:hypothetical protein
MNQVPSKYKIDIPGLFSLSSSVSKIKGFTLFDADFDNLKDYVSGNLDDKPHYTYQVGTPEELVGTSEFTYRWLSKKEDFIYYNRPLFPGVSLKYSYNIKKREFIANSLYHHLVSFEFGNIWSTGKVLSNIFVYDLAKKGFETFHGMAFEYKGKVVCMLSPGGNYKSPLLRYMIKKGATYISGDKLIIKDGRVYYVPPLPSEKLTVEEGRYKETSYQITHVFFAFFADSDSCTSLKDRLLMRSYLNTYSMFNFLGTGWMTNMQMLLDRYIATLEKEKSFGHGQDYPETFLLNFTKFKSLCEKIDDILL